MIKAEITTKKGCTVKTEGFTENILEELLAIIFLIINSVLERLNFPEEANKDIVRNIIEILEEQFLS